MFKKFIGLVLLSVGLVACGGEQGDVPEVEENTTQTVNSQAANCRKVDFKGNFYVVDDDWGRDYTKNHPFEDHVVLCRSDYSRKFHVIKPHGNEMRVELYGTALWANRDDPNDTTIKIEGRVLMFEGTSPRTGDMDAFSFFGLYPRIIIPAGESRTTKDYIESEEWNDYSSVDYYLRVRNESAQ